MIFPWDVHKRASEAHKLDSNDKIKIGITGFIVLNIAIMFITLPFFKSIGVPAIYPIIGQTLLMGAIGVFIFRIFIFKEDEKIREYRGNQTDSFAKFFYVRDIDNVEYLNVGNRKIPVFEYSNGTCFCFVRLRYGSNNNYKAINTREIFKEIFRLVGFNNMEITQITMKENFSLAPEIRSYLQQISKIEDKKLARTMLEIVQEGLTIADQESNVDEVYLRIKTKSRIQRYDLGSVIVGIVDIIDSRSNCFRSVDLLEPVEILEMNKNFYGLEAIDLSLMKSRHNEETEENYFDSVDLYQLLSSDGKVFTNKDIIESQLTTARKVDF